MGEQLNPMHFSFLLCGATVQLAPGRLIVEVSVSHIASLLEQLVFHQLLRKLFLRESLNFFIVRPYSSQLIPIHMSTNCYFFADTISRNPAGLCERYTKELFKPNELMVTTINLGIDHSVEKTSEGLSNVPNMRQENPTDSPNCAAETKGF